jgi:hypothetical protein
MRLNTFELAELAFRQLSQALGLPKLRSGSHVLRDQSGRPNDKFFVGYVWHAIVMPSFDPWAAVGTAFIEESEFSGKHHPASLRAAVVLCDSEHVQVHAWAAAQLDTDPLADAIRGVKLVSEDTLCVDGIGYILYTSELETNDTIEIINPQQPSLRALELALFRVARIVQQKTRNEQIAAYLNAWQRYLEH